jgi:hypothetical protein
LVAILTTRRFPIQRVRLTDQEKLAFFGPDHKKYTFQVMPFGPRNAPAFYTAMMGIFRDEWNALYLLLFPDATAHFGSRVIIDDILLWSTYLPALQNYFRCVCMVFTKSRVTFQLKNPWFEVSVKPLRVLERQHHRLPIPSVHWTPPLTALWNDLKISVTSSPCLARYDASRR